MDEDGLTLVELIVILAVLSVLLIIIFPSSDLLNPEKSSLRLNITAKEVVNDLRYIQQKTILDPNRETLYFEIFPDNKGYYIKTYNDDKCIKIKELPNGIIIEKNNNRKDSIKNKEIIKFSETGTPFPGGLTITLKNSLKEIKITLVPSTGRIMLKGDY